ncbi:MAG: hypothetical protein WBO68_14140 [Pyrinomonadaceae bacterium]
MFRRIILIALLSVLVTTILPQGFGTVNTRGPLRGTANSTGIVMAFLESGETFDVVQQKGPWYLLQTSKYVGWMHGNYIRILYGSSDDLPDLSAVAINVDRPRSTTKPVTGTADDSPFREDYVGGTISTIYVTNSSNRTMNLNFGGIRYIMKNGDKKTITVDGGNYEFTASAPGVRSKTGVREFRKGYSYTWNFFIVTR